LANSVTAEQALTQRIVEGIPLAEAMRFNIDQLGERSISVSAPLGHNINVHGTGFAGSLYSTATLAAWSLTTHVLNQANIQADVVMAKAEIRYKRPVNADIHCYCESDATMLTAFFDQLSTQGRGRLPLQVNIGNPVAAILQASMVATLKD